MNEQELKKKANALRHEIDARNKKLTELYNTVKLHRFETRDLKKTRDSLNDEIKELSGKLREVKGKRDKLNKAVSDLKKSRATFIKEIKQLSSGIKDSKKIRDELNQSSRSTEELIEKVLGDKLKVLLKEDVSLEDEKKLFSLVLGLSQRIEAARKATKVHEKIVEDVKNIKGVSAKLDDIGGQLAELTEIADGYHQSVVETYDLIKAKREEANQAHGKLTEKYKSLDPTREKIGSVKEEIAKLRDEITPYNEALEDIRRKREEKKKSELASQAKEKLKTSKRISLDDLKMILDQGGMDETKPSA